MNLDPKLYSKMKDGGFRQVYVHTFVPSPSEPSSALKRVTPVPGQGFPSGLRVECSRAMREKYPAGTVFLLQAKLTKVEGTEILYSHYSWSYSVVNTPKKK